MSAETIYMLQNGVRTGPFAPEALRQMLAEGEISTSDLAWREGLAQWTPLNQVIGFNGLPPLPPPPPANTGASSRAQSPNSTATSAGSSVSQISAIIGLLLLVASVFAVGLCSKATNDLAQYNRLLNSPEGATEMFFRGLDRGMKGDALGQYFEVAETKRGLEAEASNAYGTAVICLCATALCAVCFGLDKAWKRRPSNRRASTEANQNKTSQIRLDE